MDYTSINCFAASIILTEPDGCMLLVPICTSYNTTHGITSDDERSLKEKRKIVKTHQIEIRRKEKTEVSD